MEHKPIKIVRIFSRLNIGGPSLQVTLLSEHLSPPYETILVTGNVDQKEGDMSYLLHGQKKYRHVFIPELGRNVQIWKDFIAFVKIVKLLIQEKPDIVHTHTAKAGVLGRLAAIITRVPIRVHTFHGHVFNGYFSPFKTWLIIGAEKILAYFTTGIVAISTRQKEDLVNTYKIASKDKVLVIPLGFDLSHFVGVHQDNIELKKRLNLPLNKYLIGIVGRLTPIKNHGLFLKIAKKLIQIRQDVHFVIVGNGECYREIQDEICNGELLAHCSLLGWQKELKPIYEVLDIVCLTSLNEGTPVSLIEAQACGKVVIASDVGGVRDVVLSENGYVIPLQNEDEFVQKIIYLLDHSDMRQKMGKTGQKFVFENFGKEKLLINIDELYNHLVNERKRA